MPYRTNVLYCAKGHLFARAELSMYECREPFGNPPRSGVCEQPDNPPQLVIERGFPRNHYPSPMWGGNKGATNKTMCTLAAATGRVSSWGWKKYMRQCRTFDMPIA